MCIILCLFTCCCTAEVGVGSIIEVTIEGSDNAYGTFQFADISLNVMAVEADVGVSTATLQVSV